MVVSSTRSELDERVEQTPIGEVVASLRDVVGDQIVAISAGAADVAVIGQWATGAAHPDAEAARRLRDGYRVVSSLQEQEAPDTIRAWFVGMNPELDDRAAALVIAEDPDLVMDAARFFMANG